MSDNRNLNGRAISYAKLQTGTFIPGFGNIGDTLPPMGKTLNLQMLHTDPGLYVNINNFKAEALIPWANVQVALYTSEEPNPVTYLSKNLPKAHA